MTQLVSIQKWLGHQGDTMSPESLQFTTRPAKGCRGCLFQHQHSSICDRACTVAQRAELEHCERGFIYVAKPVDPRQVSLIEKGH
ncbi:hypothetical protein ACFOHT_04765 [Massilia oculi]|uniref:Uncharacterized protein n=1 Tax=Massilia oculi TaxID=945844 RepID=A0A2S2DDC5_9BURK|nr:hypothetical protein [Massilia oculi]AWL03383.1 hypothetical protein DIR46_02230 [Massilia oculi]